MSLPSTPLRFKIEVDFEQAAGTNGILFTLDLDTEDSCVGNLQLRSTASGLSLVWYRFGVTMELQVGDQLFNNGVRTRPGLCLLATFNFSCQLFFFACWWRDYLRSGFILTPTHTRFGGTMIVRRV